MSSNKLAASDGLLFIIILLDFTNKFYIGLRELINEGILRAMRAMVTKSVTRENLTPNYEFHLAMTPMRIKLFLGLKNNDEQRLLNFPTW